MNLFVSKSSLTVIIILLCKTIFSQSPTLEYIFQDTQIVNPRPSLKYINTKSNKIYYYADDDYNGSLNLFSYNYSSGDVYKFPDSSVNVSEFRVLPDGDALIIDHGNLYISKNFIITNTFTKDLQLTNSDDYEYSPEVKGNYVIFRKKGNYFITTLNSKPGKETALTRDESDSISYEILGISDQQPDKNDFKILFARYDNSSKKLLLFPDYMTEFVSLDKQKRGISKVGLIEYELNYNKEKDTIIYTTEKIKYPDTTRFSTQYAAYSQNAENLVLDVETLDRHTRKIFNYEILDKRMNEIYSESDSAWFERHDNATRFVDDNRIIFESEISNFNNLYFLNIDGTGFKKTAGDDYTILESVIDFKNKKIYFTANIESPTEYNIYSIDFSGATPQKLTLQRGDYTELSISSDGNHLFYEHSYINKPNELYCLNLFTKEETQVTNTISQKFSSVEWNIPEEITFANEEDGELIHAFLYKPQNYSSKKKYPLICFAHGGGYWQNVTWGYSPYGDNFMVNTFLAEHGYLILDVDYRGSLGYGKNFRNKTIKNLGYWEISDYISGVDHLDKEGLIDRNKVGIYGGSYGGFITLMALFRHPDYFKAGVALRGVASWKNYYYSNRWFTLPRLGEYNEENKNYYEHSSPITYAENLQVPLLITHGMLDDNVFFQDAVQLIQKLLDNHKDFEVMIYPKEFHSFHIQSDWLDQYKRIFKFFEEHIK
jgi:dipeptidyl aminopeptidase/acylaminoacyl peptidase